MHSLNKAWIWIWELFPFQKLWMVWLWIMAILISFRVADYLLFSLVLAVNWLSLFVLVESFLSACIAMICMFEVHLRYYSVLSDLIYQGWWEKYATIRLYLLILLLCIVIYTCMWWIWVLTVIMLICNWCLLIHMNNKGWYFFLWKKKSLFSNKMFLISKFVGCEFFSRTLKHGLVSTSEVYFLDLIFKSQHM